MKILLFVTGTRLRLCRAFPCFGFAGAGDMAAVVQGDRVDVASLAVYPASMTLGLHQLLKLVEELATALRCVASAQKHFSLDEVVRRYETVYQQLGTSK